MFGWLHLPLNLLNNPRSIDTREKGTSAPMTIDSNFNFGINRDRSAPCSPIKFHLIRKKKSSLLSNPWYFNF